MRKWQDTREMLLRIGQSKVEPYFNDVFVKIVPGLFLLLGIIAVTLGFVVAVELAYSARGLADVRTWIGGLFLLILAWYVGALLQRIGHGLGYAKQIQPDGWDKYVWLEAVDDFDNLVPLRARRIASIFQTLTLASVGFGTACVILWLVEVTYLWTLWAWVLLAAVLGLILLVVLHRFIEPRVKVVLAIILAVLLFVSLARLPWPWLTILLVAAVVFWLIHAVFRKKWQQAVMRVFPEQAAAPIRPRENPVYLGPQVSTPEDEQYAGSSFAALKETLQKNPYYAVWGDGQTPLPVYKVTLGSVLRGILPFGQPWHFREAARRTVDTRADIRSGVNGRGYRKLLHPNGVCLFGTWEITEPNPYSGYFEQGRKALMIGRYSTCCTEVRRGRSRSLSLVGKLFPTENPEQVAKTASFITQQDLGGEKNEFINEAVFRNAPDTTVWRRGLGPNGVPVISITGLLFGFVDVEAAIRQLHEIAELGKDAETRTNAPKFMRIVVDENQPHVEGEDMDFRDEVMAHLYTPGLVAKDPEKKLVFHIEVSDQGETKGPAFFQRLKIDDWKRIGKMVFTEGVISYNGDHLIHFNHPTWRLDRNRTETTVRRAGQRLD